MSARLPPVLQRHWDLRAAANFVFGGAGSGLIVATAASGMHGTSAAVAFVAGLALVITGLTAVWLETGRPWRALNVLRNPRTSWMSREAWIAMALVPVVAIAAALHATASAAAPAMALPAAAVAIAFMVAQGRILRAAKGVPAWRSPAMPLLIVATALVEGAGLWWIAAVAWDHGTLGGLALFGVLIVARLATWLAYRRTLEAEPRATAALDVAGAGLGYAGTLAPLALIALAAAASDATTVTAAVSLAGVLAVAGGAWAKATIVVRAGYLQAFALPRWPVRGARREQP